MLKTVGALALGLASAQAATFHYKDQDDWGAEWPACGGGDNAKQSPVNLFTGMGAANAELFDKMLKLSGDEGNVYAEVTDGYDLYASKGLPEEATPTGYASLVQQASSAAAGKFSNTGHTLKFTPTDLDAGALTSPGPTRQWANGKVYNLAEVVFHSPSEHTVNGKQYALEAQFVHADESGALAITSVFFDTEMSGEPNSALNTLFLDIPNIGSERDVRALDLSDLTQTGPFYTYDGSITTPPCNEGVRWNVYRNPKSMSSDQLVKFNKYYRANNRDTQPLNGRYSVLNGQSPFSVRFPELDCTVDNTLPHCDGFVADL